jgi:hypothetical protein
MTLSRVRRSMTVSEFYTYCAFFDWETEQTERLEHYLAYLTYHVFEIPGRVFGKMSGVDPDKFVMKFKRSADKPETKSAEPVAENESEATEDRQNMSYAVWTAAINAAKRKVKEFKPRKGPQQPPGSVIQRKGGNPPPRPDNRREGASGNDSGASLPKPTRFKALQRKKPVRPPHKDK